MAGSVHPDCKRLARIGSAVRERLTADPSVQRFPEERAEIYAVEGFLHTDDCARLIGLIEGIARPSGLVDEADWPQYRTSYSSDIDVHDDTVRALDDSIAALTGLRLDCSESLQGQRYRCGEYFHEHYDWFDTSAEYWRRESECGGQRSWTAMVYLNCVEEGGSTDFTRMQISVPPLTGSLLLWNNLCPDGTPNPWTMHAARPVVRGVKYVVTKWFRTRRWC
ncbi:prolyl hydroxylase family protein [Novosphingobium malaysiense]|uniref:2OG-Fe(II) oxygenase n=1 Tax=Novosphingobium malaysiense TaxID=1348853 RepID=A0A0B1ZQY0_9SPHN|nr:2OG-Fe(II) oxygenase [Novosphingobium malaysiense]KHK91628.1 2OG-Fe(II) oxygenase [Novosphingobium malaysiense]